MSEYVAKWHRELEIFSKIKPILVLEGNVNDSYQYPLEGSLPKGSVVQIDQYLHFYFMDRGYRNVVFYDNLQGFYNSCDEESLRRFGALVGQHSVGRSIPAPFSGGNGVTAPTYIANVMEQNEEATVFILRFASRYITSPEHMMQPEVDSFARFVKSSLSARSATGSSGESLPNLVIFLVDKANDTPAWLLMNNPGSVAITVGHPDREERRAFVEGENFASFFHPEVEGELAYYDEHPQELERIKRRFVGMTSGLSFTELGALASLCYSEKIHVRNLCDVVDLYRYGVKDTPWKKLTAEDIRTVEEILSRRVKGQTPAVTKTVRTVKRALANFTADEGSSRQRPKGVLFFAGPTGTGKTETAKALAEAVFGDEGSVIRFDMSEYGAPHTDQKLFGAPPGYVGYEAGGQLTNAVRKNPFSVLLFDEIEKAHPTIMDKFLQILEDGRMTDGRGVTTYFNETVIIFTSNLGIYTEDASGARQEAVSRDMSYDEVKRTVIGGIQNHFTFKLGRPELLNRIGDNFAVFGFIQPEVAGEILDGQLEKLVRAARENRNIQLVIAPACRERLYRQVLANLHQNGRGVGNVITSQLLDPLSEYAIDHAVPDNCRLEIADLEITDEVTKVIATHTPL